MFPRIVDIEFSARCNLKCGFCFGPADDRTVPDLPVEFWLNVLGRLRHAGAYGLVVSGGEPTIYPHIVPVLSRARDLGLSIVLSSHGQLRNRVLACVPYLDWLALPVDGVSESMLTRMRGRAWGVQSLHMLVRDVRGIKPSIGIKLGTVATSANVCELLPLGKALVNSDVAIDTWKLYQYTARRKFKDRAQEFALADADFDRVRHDLSSALSQRHFSLVFSSNDSRRRAYLFVYPDGTVAVPNIDETMGDHVVGNLAIDGLDVLTQIPALDWGNHSSNYDGTYGQLDTRSRLQAALRPTD